MIEGLGLVLGEAEGDANGDNIGSLDGDTDSIVIVMNLKVPREILTTRVILATQVICVIQGPRVWQRTERHFCVGIRSLRSERNYVLIFLVCDR